MRAHRLAGTAGSHTIDCSQLSIDVASALLVLRPCGLSQKSSCRGLSFPELETRARTWTRKQSVPKSIQIASMSLAALAVPQKISQGQGNTGEQRILTGNVSRLLGSNTTNSPMSLTKCSIEVPCCGRARTVCSYSGLYKSSRIDEFDGGIEEGNESRR